MAQKEIMIEFYDRQATSGIRAKPEDVVEVMKQHGIEPLKENQIKNWWSTYHQKRKAALNSLAGQANNCLAAGIPNIAAGQMIPSTVPVQQSNSVPQGTTVPVTPSTCTSTVSSIPVSASTVPVWQTAPTTSGNTVQVTSVASTTPATLQTSALTVPVQQTAPMTSGNAVGVTPVASTAPAPLQSTVSPQVHASPLYGIPSSHTPCITCLLYTSPSPRDGLLSRMPSSA